MVISHHFKVGVPTFLFDKKNKWFLVKWVNAVLFVQRCKHDTVINKAPSTTVSVYRYNECALNCELFISNPTISLCWSTMRICGVI